MMFWWIACFPVAVFAFAVVWRNVVLTVQLRELQSKQPVCGCKHHLSYHDKKTGQCNNYQPDVHVTGTGALVQCKCRQYVGPEPLVQYFSPEITDS